MMDQEKLWARVQRALDDRRDPFEDAELEAWLLEDDQALDEVLRLQDTLLSLGHRVPTRTREWVRPVALAAGIGGLLVGAGLLLEGVFAPPGSSNVEPPPVAQLTAEGRGARILEVSISVVTESESARTVTFFDGQQFTRQREVQMGAGTGPLGPRSKTLISTLVPVRFTP